MQGTSRPEPKLIVILGSHACRAGMLLLEHKGIEYTTIRLPSGTQRLLRVRGWPGGTVPALVMDGERVQGNLEIARHLDRVQPEPPLYPADPERRRQVEEAELWADDVFQMSARRIALAATMDGLDAFSDRADRGRLGPLLWTTQGRRKVGMKVVRRVFNVNRRTEPRLLRKLPAQLDRIDAWIDAGVLN